MKYEMDADQRFFFYIMKWAESQNCTFVAQGCDGRESDHLIDGMAADDVWGWLLPKGISEISDDYFGCVVWQEVDGKIILSWETYSE